MEGVLHTTLLTTGLFLSSLLPQASTSAALSPLPVIGQESFHAVKEGETLSDIAKKEYKDPQKVDIILKDNPWISNPDYIDEGWEIKIRKNPLLDTPDPVVASESSVILPQTDTPTPTPTNAPIQQESLSEAPTQAVTPVVVSVTPTTPPPAVTYTGGPLSDEQLNFLGNCESGMTATRNSGNGFYGAFQFSIGTWNNMGTGYDRADLAPLDVQKDAVQRLLSRSSIFTQFPGCARKMAAAGLL